MVELCTVKYNEVEQWESYIESSRIKVELCIELSRVKYSHGRVM